MIIRLVGRRFMQFMSMEKKREKVNVVGPSSETGTGNYVQYKSNTKKSVEVFSFIDTCLVYLFP